MGLPRFVGQLDKDYLGLLRFKVSRALVVEKREGTRQAEEDEAGTINVYPALKRWASLIRRPSPVGTACARGWKYRTGSRIEFVAQMQLAVRLFNLTEKTK